MRTHLAAQWAADCGQFEDARNYAAQALALDKNSQDAKMALGLIAYYLGDYPQAEGYFQQVLRAQPANVNASDRLALTLCEQGDPDKLQRAFQYPVVDAKLANKQPGAYATLGWVYYKMGRLNEAAAALKNAIQLGPVSRDTAYYAAQVSAEAGDIAQAKSLLDLALRASGPFAKRPAAKALAAKLNRPVRAAWTAAGTPPS